MLGGNVDQLGTILPRVRSTNSGVKIPTDPRAGPRWDRYVLEALPLTLQRVRVTDQEADRQKGVETPHGLYNADGGTFQSFNLENPTPTEMPPGGSATGQLAYNE